MSTRRLHEDCWVCDVVNDPLPHTAEPRSRIWVANPARKVPAHVALYCAQTGQDVPDLRDAS